MFTALEMVVDSLLSNGLTTNGVPPFLMVRVGSGKQEALSSETITQAGGVAQHHTDHVLTALLTHRKHLPSIIISTMLCNKKNGRLDHLLGNVEDFSV